MDQSLGVRVPSLFFNGILIVQSFILWGVGAAYLIIGVTLHHVLSNLYQGSDALYKTAPFLYISIALGISLIVTSYFTNAIILFPSLHRYGLLSLVYLGVIVFIFMHYANGKYSAPFLKKALKKGIEHVMDNFNGENVLNNHLNAFQATLRCCGTYNYTTWFDTAWAGGVPKVPPSCCKDVQFCHNLQPLVESDIFQKGCYIPIDAFILVLKVALFSTFLGTNVIQIAGALCALIMAIRYQKMHQLTAVVPSE